METFLAMSRDFTELTFAEVKVEQSQSSQVTPKPDGTASEALLAVFFGLAALGAIATFITKEFHHKKEQKELKGKLSKIPCPNCQYFSKSSYLRCAVQPKLTMSNEAMDCHDFTPSSKS